MKGILVVLVIIALIPMVISCARPSHTTKALMKGAGDGVKSVTEGIGKGVYGLGKGLADSTQKGVQATGYGFSGKAEESIQAGAESSDAADTGLKAIIVEPLKGLGQGLQDIEDGIQRAKAKEEVK